MTDSELAENVRIVERIDRAMAWRYGSLGDSVSWKDLARLNRWSTTVMHTIRRGERTLKLDEARRIIRRLDFRGGWICFGEQPERDAARDDAARTVPRMPPKPVEPATGEMREPVVRRRHRRAG